MGKAGSIFEHLKGDIVIMLTHYAARIYDINLPTANNLKFLKLRMLIT